MRQKWNEYFTTFHSFLFLYNLLRLQGHEPAHALATNIKQSNICYYYFSAAHSKSAVNPWFPRIPFDESMACSLLSIKHLNFSKKLKTF